MSDKTNVHHLPSGAPIVPDLQNQPAEATALLQRTQDPLLDQIIARTVREIEERQAQRPSPFGLHTFEDIDAFAERMAQSSLCPKDFQRKPGDIVIAVLWGKELGLPAMSAIQSIAVVNGRPSLWGEAVPALCIRTGQVLDKEEFFEGDDPNKDEFKAVCIVTRRGYSPQRGEFSTGDARKAGLKNVHLSYPKDMLMWRARHRAWHGAFPDVLKGLATAEIEADLAGQPQWTMPRPARSDTVRTAKAEGDAWDDRWFDQAARQLFEEQDPWKWLALLQDYLKEAPSARDVREIESLGTVQRAMGSAPDEVKETIALAFREADARFGTPPLAEEPDEPDPTKPKRAPRKKAAETAAAARTEAPVQQAGETTTQGAAQPQPQPEPPDAPEFEYCVLDEQGEPVDGEILTDPVAWARAYAENADPRTMGYLSLREHNADAIADAKRHPEAAKILAALEAEEPANDPPADPPHSDPPGVIEPTLVRGKPDWPQYIKDLTAALAAATAQRLPAFVDAQRERAAKFPASTRMQASKVVAERAAALGIAAPAGFEAAPADTAPPPADAPVSDGASSGAVDKERTQMQNIVAGLAGLATVYDVTHYSNQQTVVASKKRWEREGRPELASEMARAFEARIAEIKLAEAGAKTGG